GFTVCAAPPTVSDDGSVAFIGWVWVASRTEGRLYHIGVSRMGLIGRIRQIIFGPLVSQACPFAPLRADSSIRSKKSRASENLGSRLSLSDRIASSWDSGHST